ncbi:MAG: AMP-binding protein, partial [Clostridia bacterium]|nr:AMP-binding protein [Clostridia bacterium]
MRDTYQINKLSSFRELVERSAKKYAHKNAFVLRDGKDKYRTIKYKELKESYYSLCSYFLSQGLEGKSIAVIGGNCYEWTLCYLAAASVGTVVPLDKELSVEDVDNFLENAECDTICADSKIISALSFGENKQYKVFSFESVDKEYSHFGYDNLDQLNRIEISKDKTSALIFTSGTTGSAKGVCLSQHNLLSNIRSSLKMVKFTSKDTTLSILPLHHTYECTLNCLLMLSVGACITYADSLLKITKNVVEYSPTVLVVVPALLKMMDKKITQSVKSNCPERYKHLFDGEQFSKAFVKLPYFIRKIISSKVRKSLGGELRLFIVGAADLDSNIVENFCAMGIKVLQGYGLTECSPLVAGNSDFYFNAKSKGRAIPDVKVRIETPNSDGIG